MQKKPNTTLAKFLHYHFWQLFFLISAFLVTTIPFVTTYPFNWDAAQFVLGVENYAVDMHQPHPPGYPLYIAVAKVFHFFVSSHIALLIETGLFALASTITMYVLIYRIWRQRWLAVFTTSLWLVNPMFWMYREAALTYVIDSLAILLLLLFTHILLAAPKQQAARYTYYSTITLAVLGGFRPSMIVLLAPVLLVQWIYIRSWKTIAISITLAISLCLAWYIPMVIDTGGLTEYQAASQTLYGEVASRSSGLYGATWDETFRQVYLVLLTLIASWNIVLVLMIIGIVSVIYYAFKGKSVMNWSFTAAICASIIVPLGIYGLIHIGQLGYLLIILPVGYVMAAYAVREIHKLQYPKLRWIGLVGVGIVFALHMSVFLFFEPAYTHPEFFPKKRTEVWFQYVARKIPELFQLNAALLKNSDVRLGEFVDAVSMYSPEEVVVITGRNVKYPASNGLLIRNDERFRELGASLPEYLVVQISSDSEEYIQTQQYKTKHVKKPVLVLPHSVKYIIIALNHIPVGDEPKGLAIETKTLPGGQQYYAGSIEDMFTFYQVTIKRGKK